MILIRNARNTLENILQSILSLPSLNKIYIIVMYCNISNSSWIPPIRHPLCHTIFAIFFLVVCKKTVTIWLMIFSNIFQFPYKLYIHCTSKHSHRFEEVGLLGSGSTHESKTHFVRLADILRHAELWTKKPVTNHKIQIYGDDDKK